MRLRIDKAAFPGTALDIVPRHRRGVKGRRGTHSALFRFYAQLNDFLPQRLRQRELRYWFNGSPSIKDAIEAQGVPHPEVDMILVDGRGVGFAERLAAGRRVSVYPRFCSDGLQPDRRLRPVATGRKRFVLDVHLGKLARLLRLLGFDAVYGNDLTDPQIVALAVNRQRIVLTRDRGILMHRAVDDGYWIRSSRPESQAVDVIRHYDLAALVRPMTRCLRCNGRMAPVDKSEVRSRLEPGTAKCYDHFLQCTGCRQVYWKGAHYDGLSGVIQRVLAPFQSFTSGQKRAL